MGTESQPIVAYKGFDANLACRGYQFQVGMHYEHDGKVQACSGGFHACEYPLDVFGYYEPAKSRFCSVEMSGKISRDESDSKLAAAKLTVTAEIGIPGIVSAALAWIMSKIDTTLQQTNTGNWSAATNTGDRSAATNTGNWSAAKVEGCDSVAIATGFESTAAACEGSAIVICRRDDDGKLMHIFASIVGQNGIEAGVAYMLDESGKPVAVKDGE